MPSQADLSASLSSPTSSAFRQNQTAAQRRSSDTTRRGSLSAARDKSDLPLPATTPGDVGTKTEKVEFLETTKPSRPSNGGISFHSNASKTSLVDMDDLLPARMPPRYSYLDLFPFSLLVKPLTRRGKKVRGKKAALLRAKLHQEKISHNLPLEISLYIVRFHHRA